MNDAIVLGKLGDVERMLKNIETHLNQIDKKLEQIHNDLP